MQTRKKSLLESIVNTTTGFLLSYATLLAVNYLYGLELSYSSSFEITLIFTFISVARNYVIRRWFNKR